MVDSSDNKNTTPCDTCALKNLGCVIKDAVLASGGSECSMYSLDKITKTAENILYKVSWKTKSGKTIVHAHGPDDKTSE